MRFPARPPEFDLNTLKEFTSLVPFMKPVLPNGRFLHWNELRRRPAPPGLTHEKWWAAQRLARLSMRTFIPGFIDQHGVPFSFCRIDAISRATHEIDRRDVARELVEAIGDEAVRDRYRLDQLIEEAIHSSVIEGAKITTREQAASMIRESRPPTSRGERMVLNNYRAMERLLELANKDLELSDLLEIHAIVGEDALEKDEAAGRLRRSDEKICVEDQVSGEVWYVPPPAENLPKRLEALLRFANDRDSDSAQQFIHPLLRAMILHFWLAYEHPFVDGNGRMARAMFYWQMLRCGYDLAQYLSISGPIDRSPRSYYLAFAYTETDDADLTYFVLHQLSVLRQATTNLTTRLREHHERMRDLSRTLKDAEDLNHRQRTVLSHLIRHPHEGVTMYSHAKSHSVSYLTARKDLHELEARGLIRRAQSGRQHRFFPSRDLANRVTGGR